MSTQHSDSPSFQVAYIISRATAGDADAVQVLLSRFSTVIARELRTQKRFQGLQARLDPDDIAQSVWRCFFTALVGGELVFSKENEVAAFLTRLTRNRIETQFRAHLAQKRDIRKTINSHEHEREFESKATANPVHVASTLEFLQSVMDRMTPEERHVAKRREEGATWEQLALEIGTTAEGLRKRHTRMAERILSELDPENEST